MLAPELDMPRSVVNIHDKVYVLVYTYNFEVAVFAVLADIDMQTVEEILAASC